ncbi:MAG: phosphate ABC transporter substrate-binding protein PstS [Actinobacteria bacterium]|nr:phosphate ABC transporter substrate-binding protein PstS [Actinomycetota bacterium]
MLTVSITGSLTACGSGAGNAPDLVSGLEGLDIDYSTLTASLNGSGSSFQDPLQQAVAGQFARHTGGAQVNYQKSGSSAGKADLASNTVQYAGSDSVIKPEEAAEFTGDVLYFPIAASSITISYNLPDVADLNLTPELLAKIFQAEITVWNDPEIVEHNPTAALPAIPIGVIRRSDGSGTTSNFTKYLAKAAPEVWKLGTGESIEWPPSSQGAEKSSGVSILINTTEGAIGYADLSDSVAAGLQRAKVQNSAGNFVEPKLANVSEAIASADIADDLTYDPLNAPGADAYPITAPTWIITYAAQRDHDRAESLRGYLNFFLTEGQAIAPSLGYAPLPEAVRMRAIEQLERIAVP